MRRKVITLLMLGMIAVLSGCQHSATAGNEPESVDTTTEEQETDEPTIFDQLVIGEAID